MIFDVDIPIEFIPGGGFLSNCHRCFFVVLREACVQVCAKGECEGGSAGYYDCEAGKDGIDDWKWSLKEEE